MALTPLEDFVTVKEGQAEILFPKANSVFYNPVQEFNRDITIAVITEYIKGQLKKRNIDAVEYKREDTHVVDLAGEEKENMVYPGELCEDGVTILEALSATGLRSIRFAKELPGVKKIVANDLSKDAFKSIKCNITHNGVENVVEPNVSDAAMLMYGSRGKEKVFDIIDIDPYGSASMFLDSAVQAVKPGGLLCVTCTDMAVLAGNFPEAAWAKYQSFPMKTKACHEQALRILLGSISSHAARYSRYIEPLVSISIDFYVRIFVRVHYGPSKTKVASSKQMYVYRCGGCTSFHIQNMAEVRAAGNSKTYHAGDGPPVNKRCDQCNHKYKMGGPFWGAPLYDCDFVKRVLASVKNMPTRYGSSERIIGILTMIDQELHDVPLYYVIDELSSVIKCNVPPAKVIRSAVLNAGFRTSSFHGRINSLKTNAPPAIIWDIMRKWRESQNMKKSKLSDDSAGKSILEKPITSENIDLTVRSDGELPAQFARVTRFPELPPNWGPKSKAKINNDGSVEVSDSLKEKSRRFQGKRKNKQGDKNNNKKIKNSEKIT